MLEVYSKIVVSLVILVICPALTPNWSIFLPEAVAKKVYFLLHKFPLLFFGGEKDPFNGRPFCDTDKLRHLLKNIGSVVTRVKNIGKSEKERREYPCPYTVGQIS
ncbi:hypothetical protein AVEN_204570-1 [Araneus ventricosus]|uniref:Uncharacterized protein n=1 Tax=Araneus ventricosus TaxID=182803 RepID=A0A4Y2IFN7_ARAVE|nr:hypothetical protein AVEN_204570-1 [Araneus ventricosus]